MCRKAAVDQKEEQAAGKVATIASTKLEKGDEWLDTFDFEGFRAEIQALGKKLEAEQGPVDVVHLNKMVMWSNTLAFIGLVTMGFGINPVSIIGISTFTFSRFIIPISSTRCAGLGGMPARGST